MTLAPGESSPVHRHACDYIVGYVEPLDAIIIQDERRRAARFESGYVGYFPVKLGGGELQRLTNDGTKWHRHFVIELRGTNESAPYSSNDRSDLEETSL